jgi:hypothetical protein
MGEQGELDQGVQEQRQPPQQQAEVVAGGGENGICAIAFEALQVVAVIRCSAFRWPITGSMAARRRISLRMLALGGIFVTMLEHHPNGALAHLRRKLRRIPGLVHCSILSKERASGKPGAVQGALCPSDCATGLIGSNQGDFRPGLRIEKPFGEIAG